MFVVCCLLFVLFQMLLEPALFGDEEEVVHDVLRRSRKLCAQHWVLIGSKRTELSAT